jgi:hypothetical protein
MNKEDSNPTRLHPPSITTLAKIEIALKSTKLAFCQRFSETVCYLIMCRNNANMKLALSNSLSNKMNIHSNVLGLSMKNWIGG